LPRGLDTGDSRKERRGKIRGSERNQKGGKKNLVKGNMSALKWKKKRGYKYSHKGRGNELAQKATVIKARDEHGSDSTVQSAKEGKRKHITKKKRREP